jgi:hypothetical protein
LAPLLLATCVAAGWRVGSPTEVGERERTEEEGDVASQVEAQERGLATTLPTRLEDAHCACKEEEGAEGGRRQVCWFLCPKKKKMWVCVLRGDVPRFGAP